MKDKWIPEVGEKVAVCYDGKLGRAVLGEVVQVRGFCAQFKYHQWAEGGENEPVLHWMVRKSWHSYHEDKYYWSYSGYLRVDDSLMRRLIGSPGDYYSAIRLSDIDEEYRNKILTGSWETTTTPTQVNGG